MLILDPNHSGEGGRSRHAIVVLGMYNAPKKPIRLYLLAVWAFTKPVGSTK